MEYAIEVVEQLLRNDPEKAMQYLFQKYYSPMCDVVYRVLQDRSISEDIVQEVFMEVWRKRNDITFSSSITGYLKRSCVNRSLNHIRRNKFAYDEESALAFQYTEEHIENRIESQDLQEIINQSIESLPDRCREVFMLSRFENMSYKEIGDALEISVKTVENQIAKALKVLKSNVIPYMGNPI